MLVGIPKEIKTEEHRVSMTPAGVEVIRQNGHQVWVEQDAGLGSGFDNSDYTEVGAIVVPTPAEIYAHAQMVMHVKEPQPAEFDMLRKDQIIFTYLHLAADETLTRALIRSGSIIMAYETIQSRDGALPLLTPMSEVAGRMSIQQAAKYLEMPHGGRGVLLGGVPGVDPATIVIIGGGVVGTQAARMACGLGAKVFLLDNNLRRLRHLDDVMPPNCFLIMSNPAAIRHLITKADAVIGAVLVPGAKAPRLITRKMLATMKPGAVLVDVAIDQGGCFETSRPTTHADPIYDVDGIVHYCVSNMPGAVAMTSTLALTNATLPYAVQIATKGWHRAMAESAEIKSGANVIQGKVTNEGVASAFGLAYTPVDAMLRDREINSTT